MADEAKGTEDKTKSINRLNKRQKSITGRIRRVALAEEEEDEEEVAVTALQNSVCIDALNYADLESNGQYRQRSAAKSSFVLLLYDSKNITHSVT